MCNEEFTTIVDGSERNKLYKEYTKKCIEEHTKKCIEEERKRTQEIQESFDVNQRKAKIANNIFNTILFIVMIIILWVLITVW